MKSFISLLLPLAPALVLFGTLIIVIAPDPSNHLWAVAGAFMAGVGILLLIIKIMDQSRQIEEIMRLLKGNEQKMPVS
jgi:hypothetical protein